MGIKISRLQGKDAVELLPRLAEHLVFPAERDQSVKFLQQVTGMLANAPEQIQFIVATRDEELVGFVLSNVAEDCVYIAQMWSKPGNSFRIADEMFLYVLLWAVGLGKPCVRATTSRSAGAFYERAGFKQTSVVIERQVDQEMLHKMLNRARDAFLTLPEEIANG